MHRTHFDTASDGLLVSPRMEHLQRPDRLEFYGYQKTTNTMTKQHPSSTAVKKAWGKHRRRHVYTHAAEPMVYYYPDDDDDVASHHRHTPYTTKVANLTRRAVSSLVETLEDHRLTVPWPSHTGAASTKPNIHTTTPPTSPETRSDDDDAWSSSDDERDESTTSDLRRARIQARYQGCHDNMATNEQPPTRWKLLVAQTTSATTVFFLSADNTASRMKLTHYEEARQAVQAILETSEPQATVFELSLIQTNDDDIANTNTIMTVECPGTKVLDCLAQLVVPLPRQDDDALEDLRQARIRQRRGANESASTSWQVRLLMDRQRFLLGDTTVTTATMALDKTEIVDACRAIVETSPCPDTITFDLSCSNDDSNIRVTGREFMTMVAGATLSVEPSPILSQFRKAVPPVC